LGGLHLLLFPLLALSGWSAASNRIWKSETRLSVEQNFHREEFGGGLNAIVKMYKDQLLLREFETEEYVVWDYPGNSINIIAPFFCLEGGDYFS